jgi:subtilisin-like proprotein convertase family protein
MQNPSNQVTYPLLRKGQHLSIVKVPDEFTIRTLRGVDDKELSHSFDCQYKEAFYKQNLSLLSVKTTERDAVMDRIRSSEGVRFASHVYALENDPLARIYLTDEINIQFKPEVDERKIEELIHSLAINYVKPVKGVVNCHVFRLSEASKMNPLKMAALLENMDETIYAEANVGIKSVHYYTPGDSLYGMQWHLHHDGGVQLRANSHVEAQRAWDITRGDRSICVAIVDDSVDLNHRDFLAPDKVVAPRDFKGFDFNPAPESPTDNHGTSCAGVAVAEENGQGVVGVAPECSLMPIRTTGFLDDNSIEDIFEWAIEKGAAVISNSWGPGSINFPLSIRQEQVISRAAREGRNGKGCVILFAAGNANRPINAVVRESGWPNDVLRGRVRWLNGYAAHPDVITVSACTSENKKSAYSSWGKEISICAPSNNAHPVFGEGITHPGINTVFSGRGITTTDRVGPLGYSSSDYTTTFGGTSSACPLAAGIAALVLSANPELTATEVRDILEQTADKIEDNSTDPQLGLQLGTYDSNGHSEWFGYGKVNAFKAVTEAIRRLENGQSDTEEETINTSSKPELTIPDNDPNGIGDIILIPQNGILTGIQLEVKIRHTYIGDLVVELLSPTGERVALHNRSGGSADNIDATYDLQNTPALSSLIGKDIRGQWSLLISDWAAQDVGRLEEWSLQLKVKAKGNNIVLDESPGVTIPDAEPDGLIRRLTNTTNGIIKGLEVEVDISHTYKSDLIVALRAPSGQLFTLHNRSGGSEDNIKTIYTPDNFFLLGQLLGTEAAGNWQLEVRDFARQDVGKLNRWAVRLKV